MEGSHFEKIGNRDEKDLQESLISVQDEDQVFGPKEWEIKKERLVAKWEC